MARVRRWSDLPNDYVEMEHIYDDGYYSGDDWFHYRPGTPRAEIWHRRELVEVIEP